jgi:hypothetical protein
MLISAFTKDLSFAIVLPALAEEQKGGWPWWAWLLLISVVFLIVLILWSWLRRSGEKENIHARSEHVIPVPPAPVKSDDLAVIEGIGPKIASVLQAAGITTFTQLAEAELARLEKILKDANLRLADPGTWGEQAKLAADGKWDELKVLQDNLKGGRRA